jgi:hypothetical protein
VLGLEVDTQEENDGLGCGAKNIWEIYMAVRRGVVDSVAGLGLKRPKKCKSIGHWLEIWGF